MAQTKQILLQILDAVVGLRSEIHELRHELASRVIPAAAESKDQMRRRLQEEAAKLECPDCAGAMILRQRTGHPSQMFFGCSNYPSCDGLRNLDGSPRRRFVVARKTGRKRPEVKKKVTHKGTLQSTVRHGFGVIDETTGQLRPTDPGKLEMTRPGNNSRLRFEPAGDGWELFEIR